MASWMVHLRVADALLDKIADLDQTAFVVGSIAPDSGVPNSDWSAFTPPKTVTHYHRAHTREAHKRIDLDAFCAEYFTPQHIQGYSKAAYSFFLGYYIHLLTDVEWARNISRPAVQQHPEEYAENRAAFTERMKEDWYDLDFRFLREHPGFRAFQLYEQAAGFRNSYMKEFSADAFDDRRAYICGFYRSEEHGPLYREYPYLPPERADLFVQETAGTVMPALLACEAHRQKKKGV